MRPAHRSWYRGQPPVQRALPTKPQPQLALQCSVASTSYRLSPFHITDSVCCTDRNGKIPPTKSTIASVKAKKMPLRMTKRSCKKARSYTFPSSDGYVPRVSLLRWESSLENKGNIVIRTSSLVL